MAVVDLLPYEPWRDPAAILHGGFRWRLGVRPLDPADWFEFGPDADEWIAEKVEVMERHRPQVFVALDDATPECVEVADAVAGHLAVHHRDRPHALDPGLHPLDAAARLVPDDLTVMVERDGRLVFGAGSVCFPNRWDLPSKLGASMEDVHTPVARLNDQLAPNISRFLDTLTSDRSFTRFGWGVTDVADGFAPPRTEGSVRAAPIDFDDRFVRVERETLSRFPATRCVLFTIRTYVAPVSAVRADPSSYAALRRAVDAMPADIARYKDLTETPARRGDPGSVTGADRSHVAGAPR